jgi:hypothetical protein
MDTMFPFASRAFKRRVAGADANNEFISAAFRANQRCAGEFFVVLADLEVFPRFIFLENGFKMAIPVIYIFVSGARHF